MLAIFAEEDGCTWDDGSLLSSETDTDSGGQAYFDEWKASCLDALDSIHSSGNILRFLRTQSVPKPRVANKRGDKPISLPLTADGAEAIRSISCHAPFGRGTKPYSTQQVRRTWELDNGHYKTANPAWQPFLKASSSGTLPSKLGLSKVVAKAAQASPLRAGVLLQAPQRFREELVWLAPSLYVFHHAIGAAMCIFPSRAKQHTLATSPTSEYDLTVLGWYSDVTHEVEGAYGWVPLGTHLQTISEQRHSD